jgi:hypothetical protein
MSLATKLQALVVVCIAGMLLAALFQFSYMSTSPSLGQFSPDNQ